MRKDLFTILQLGASFALIFSAFNSQGLIEVTVLRKKAEQHPETGITNNSGYYSLSIIYLFFTFTNLLVPCLVKKFGAKWSQVFGACGYFFFMLTFLYLNVYLLYIGSAVLGGSAALLWAGNGCYLVQASRPTKLERNSGVFWAMNQFSLITGGFFLMFVLRSGDLAESSFFIYTVFSIMILTGISIMVFLPTSPVGYAMQHDEEEDDFSNPLIQTEQDVDDNPAGFTQHVSKTLTLLQTHNMLCLCVVFIYSGLEMTFYTGVYTSCLSATLLLKHADFIIPFNALSIGAGQICGGLMAGSIQKFMKLQSQQIIVSAFCGHIIAFALAFLCLPFDSTMRATESPTYISPTLPLVLMISFLLGITDALWQTQLYVTIGRLFKNDTIDAFAIYKFFQSLSACISFFYSSFLLLPVQLLILAIGCIASVSSFMKIKTRDFLVDENSIVQIRT